MNQKDQPPQHKKPNPTAEDYRKARLAAALRENLKRRKKQGKLRAGDGGATPADESGDKTD